MGLTNCWPYNLFIKQHKQKKSCQICCNIWLFDIIHKIRHEELKSRLLSIVDFALKVEDKTFIRLWNNGTTYWGNKTKGGLSFSKKPLKTAIWYRITILILETWQWKSQLSSQLSALFWANFFLRSYGEEYMSSLFLFSKIKARHFHSKTFFTDNLCAINDGEELRTFLLWYMSKGTWA